MRTKRILSPLGAIILALALFQTACGDGGTPTAELVITTASLPGGMIGTEYTQTLAATGGKVPYQWSLGPGQSLPAGLALSAGGVISGSPTASGDFSVGVRVTDAGARAVGRTYALAIIAGLQTLVPSALPDGHQYSPYNFTLTATGGTAPYSWSIVGVLPAGLSLSAAGVISGAATVNGAFHFSVKVTDGAGASVEVPVMFNITIPAISITSGALPDGETNVVYSKANVAIGGAPPYSWTVAGGALPGGLTLTSGGVIAGTPSGSGVSNFTLQVADGASNVQNAAFTLTVHPAVTVATTALQNVFANHGMGLPLGANGGVAPYVWSLENGTLPAGVSILANGTVGGITSAVGTYHFRVKVVDALGGTAGQDLTLVVVPPQVTITTASLPNMEVNMSLSWQMTANGTPPYSWSINAGALPASLSLSPGGLISGTVTAAGPVTVVIQVTDGAGSTFAKGFTFAVLPAVKITTTSVPAAQVNNSYSQTLAAINGMGGYTWNKVLGVLPAGMTLSPTGVLAGTPTALGSFTFTARVIDGAGITDTRPFTLVVDTQGLTITTASLPDCDAEMPYDQQLVASGGSSPYSWSITSGALFAGWTLNARGEITGTCGSSGSRTFTVKVADNAGATQTQTYTITQHTDPVITTTTLPDGKVGVPYHQTLVATGGLPPYAWSLYSNVLPDGLTLDPITGVISGTPTAAGDFPFHPQAMDATGTPAFRLLGITIVP